MLREFACYVATNAPEVVCVADLRATTSRPTSSIWPPAPRARGGMLTKTGLAEHSARCAPVGTGWRSGTVTTSRAACSFPPATLPLRDAPLPRFLDDDAFTKLLQAGRADCDPFVRLAVEVLARTGMRKGEFLDLTVDSVVQIEAAYWLHVPLGKLRSDRYITLHPQLKELLDEWLANRPTSLRTPYLFVEHGQRIRQNRVDRTVAKAAQTAGIGHVNPHRLRHTLATQAINRGVSLEAIAALLGHRSMRMTMGVCPHREPHRRRRVLFGLRKGRGCP